MFCLTWFIWSVSHPISCSPRINITLHLRNILRNQVVALDDNWIRPQFANSNNNSNSNNITIIRINNDDKNYFNNDTPLCRRLKPNDFTSKVIINEKKIKWSKFWISYSIRLPDWFSLQMKIFKIKKKKKLCERFFYLTSKFLTD